MLFRQLELCDLDPLFLQPLPVNRLLLLQLANKPLARVDAVEHRKQGIGPRLQHTVICVGRDPSLLCRRQHPVLEIRRLLIKVAKLRQQFRSPLCLGEPPGCSIGGAGLEATPCPALNEDHQGGRTQRACQSDRPKTGAGKVGRDDPQPEERSTCQERPSKRKHFPGQGRFFFEACQRIVPILPDRIECGPLCAKSREA